MTGPTVMALGPYAFTTLGFGFQGRTTATETPWAEISVAGGPDQMQWLGGKGTSRKIRGVLFSEFGGQASLEGIKASAQNGVALPLVSLGNFPFNVFGMYVVTRVSEDEDFIDRNGRAGRNAYEISLTKRPSGGVGTAGSLLSLIF
ncbi:hypothetical protein AN189_07210 [Loktanella sp. 3ANDIMAR09]|uniref:phage tail protein n=1 Tax=Loktanella sp. 3ANDIMAR09 TaxID=1225657 RepID=UPI000707AAB2|nr:phage tail protein [Loktanella sp. 3ANDIMAR09]KQI68689.1 hypothetical protein AN189_07210 [Loktanella sp. 3ANDIMAR09]